MLCISFPSQIPSPTLPPTNYPSMPKIKKRHHMEDISVQLGKEVDRKYRHCPHTMQIPLAHD